MAKTTNAIERVFGRSRVLLPVIHPVSERTAMRSIARAVECGADGVFLINQGMTAGELLDFLPVVRLQYDKLWIGVNLLGVPPHVTLELVCRLPVGGIWTDNAQIDESSDVQREAEKFQAVRRSIHWPGLYFGGVAFKYQREVAASMLPVAARRASPWMDVITTSTPCWREGRQFAGGCGTSLDNCGRSSRRGVSRAGRR